MEEKRGPLEKHNKLEFTASTCVEGPTKWWLDHHYALLKQFNPVGIVTTTSCIEKKVSIVVGGAEQLLDGGNVKLILPTRGILRIEIEDEGCYYLVREGEGFLYNITKVKPIIRRKLLLDKWPPSYSPYKELFFRHVPGQIWAYGKDPLLGDFTF